MSFEAVSPKELDKLISFYDEYEHDSERDKTPFLQLLSWIEKTHAAEKITERKCQPGEVIMRENEPGNFFYIIKSGQAVVVKGDLETPTILGFRGVGDAIGEMALLDNLPRSATVIALNHISLHCLNREVFFKFISENPSFSLELMSMLSSRVRKSDEERMHGHVREKQQVVVLETLSKQATHDPLTGLFNRRYLDQILYGEIAHARQNSSLVGILMADVDHFKQINDKYGHKAGDLMLQELGALMKKSVRLADIVCRYGGEEFVIIMPGASESTVSKCAEEIRSKFEALSLQFENQEIKATISLGAAIYPLHGADVDEVFIHADRALYQAKGKGRNRVVVYSGEPKNENVN